MSFFRKENDRPDVKAILSVVMLGVMVIAVCLLRYNQHGFGRGRVTIGDGPAIPVEIAASDVTRERGLSGRTGLDPDSGMLFLFASADRRIFWMKGMEMPIDVIWIRGGEIIDITSGLLPPVEGDEIAMFSPVSPADSVLEVPAGFAARHGLRLGLPVKFDIDRRGALR